VSEVKSIVTPIRLEYTYAAAAAAQSFLHGLAEGKILGQRCPVDGKVYVPPRGSCPEHAVSLVDELEVKDSGTVTTFCIVRIPAENLSVDPPFVAAHVLLDGADIPFFHVIHGCRPEDVRMGMRVRAVWASKEELAPTLRSIHYFEPSGEPDASFDSFQEHL
jgi:uncharacterized OB-fold protein